MITCWRSAGVAAMALTAVLLAGGCASFTPAGSEIFLTRDQRVVAQPAQLLEGEAILDVENDDDAEHQVVLARLDPSVAPEGLPVVDGAVPVGDLSDIRYEGQGYTVIAKLDQMPAYFQGRNRIKAVIHEYLEPGRYVLLCNLPGHYQAGEFTQLTVVPSP